MALPELDGLIVEHLADIDRATARLEQIQSAVFKAMGDRAEKWAGRHGWAANFSYPEGGWNSWDSWVAPPEWRTADTAPDDNAFDAWFQFEVGAGDTEAGIESEDWFYLTRLCRVGVGQVGLRFSYGVVKLGAWKKAFPGLTNFVSATGFIADTKPSFFLPFAIEPGALAAALRDEEPDAALQPFEAALDTLLASKPAFDLIVHQLRSSVAQNVPILQPQQRVLTSK